MTRYYRDPTGVVHTATDMGVGLFRTAVCEPRTGLYWDSHKFAPVEDDAKFATCLACLAYARTP